MTAGDELSAATAEVITANDIVHVQIVGAAGAVSADVASALTTLGVDTVARVEGDLAAAVPVALAGLANDGCLVTPLAVGGTDEGSEAGPMFSLYFSDAVTTADNVDRIRDVVEVNDIAAVVLNAAGNAGSVCDQSRIDVTLGQTLSAGDVISIDGSSIKLGTSTDQRSFGSATATVAAPAPDRVRPTIAIVGIAGAATARSTFEIAFGDNVGLAGTADLMDDEVRIVGGPGGTSPVPTVSVAHTAGESSAVATVSRALVPGDRLVINPGAVEDGAGNQSAGTSGSAIRAQASPRINQVLMSEPKHTAHATWTVPTGSVAGAGGTGAGITIRAKGDGDAAGAAGNGWSMVFDRASTYSFAKPLDIGVRVDTRGQRVTVRFNNGPVTATLGDLIAALNGDDEFAALFSAGFTSCSLAATNNASSVALGLVAARNVAAGFSDSGRTQFAIEVRFNAFVDVVRNPQLLEDLLAAARVRTRPNAAESAADGNTRVQAAATGGDNTAAAGGLTIYADLNADSPALPSVTTSTAPTRSVRYEFETSQV